MDDQTQHLITSIATKQLNEPAKTQGRTGTKRKRSSQDANLDIPWTASRCNRLLRTITSRLSILRKSATTNTSRSPSLEEVESLPAAFDVDPKYGVDGVGSILLLNASASPGKDPEWLPQVKPKLKHAIYAAKVKKMGNSRLQRSPCSRKIGLSFPTPFRKRMLQDKTGTSGYQNPPEDTWPLPLAAKQKRTQIPLKATSTVDEAQRNLVTALGTLLRTTQPSHVRNLGTSSLMRTCLRQVPRYTDLEEMTDAEESIDDDGDLTYEVYTELESLGTNSASGWSGLREVVRFHAISKIGDAINDGLIPDLFVLSLLDVCTKTNAVQEGQAVLKAWLDRQGARSAGVMDTYLHFCQFHGTSTHLIRFLSGLLDGGLLEPKDIDSRLSIWREVLVSITHHDTQAAGIHFVGSYLNASGSQETPSEASQAFRGVLAMLTAMAMTERSEAASIPPHRSIAWAIHAIAGHDVLRRTGRSDLPMASNLLLGTQLILSACSLPTDSGFVSLETAQVASLVQVCVASPGNGLRTSKQPVTTAGFICDVANCLRTLSVELSDVTLESMIRNMAQASISFPRPISDFVVRTALDGALTWAEQHNTTRALALVEEMEDILSDGLPTVPQQTPSRQRRVRFHGYHWEDGLCEWIATTPYTATAAKLNNMEEKLSTSECERLFTRRTIQGSGLQDGCTMGAAVDLCERAKSSGPDKVTQMDAIRKRVLRPDDADEHDELALFSSTKKPRLYSRCQSKPRWIQHSRRRNVNPRPKVSRGTCQSADTSDDELGFW